VIALGLGAVFVGYASVSLAGSDVNGSYLTDGPDSARP
jgi:hypothetical protein